MLSEMCKAMEELRVESRKEMAVEMAQSLYEQGVSIEQIAKASKGRCGHCKRMAHTEGWVKTENRSASVSCYVNMVRWHFLDLLINTPVRAEVEFRWIGGLVQCFFNKRKKRSLRLRIQSVVQFQNFMFAL